MFIFVNIYLHFKMFKINRTVISWPYISFSFLSSICFSDNHKTDTEESTVFLCAEIYVLNGIIYFSTNNTLTF